MESLVTLGNVATFRLTCANSAVANALRRTILSDIPALAFHYVQFHTNSTTFPDAFLAHRFAMIPVFGNPDLLLDAAKCACDGQRCEKCSIVAHVHLKNPDFKSSPVKWGDVQPQDERAKVLFGDETLCLLGAGKELKATGWIMRGTHRQHAKWAVATVVAMRPEPVITLFESRIAKMNAAEIAEWTSVCPAKVFASDGKRPFVLDAMKCTYCRKCTEKDPALVSVESNPNPQRFSFMVEGVGNMPVVEILRSALRVLRTELSALLAAS